MCIILANGVKVLTEKMTVLNIRMSAEEKEGGKSGHFVRSFVE